MDTAAAPPILGTKHEHAGYPYDRADRWGVPDRPKGMSVINVNHPEVLDLIDDYRSPERWDSAAFLIWYLENYYRLVRREAEDSVCDKGNDKGIDGIWVNEDDETIVVFQSKLIENPKKTIGDAGLRPFAGTLRQFETVDGLQSMIDAAGMAKVAELVKRLGLISKLGTYTVRGEFLCNVNIDANGTPYLKSAPNITFVGKEYLESRYIADSRDLPSHPALSFDTRGYSVTEYKLDKNTRAVIAPVKAAELVRLDGIADQSLFAYNTRGPLGKTAINRAIVTSIKNRNLHKAFPLFHNGITIIASRLTVKKDSISTSEYYVVNGCQSLTSLFENQGDLTGDLRILTKFIQLDKSSKLAEQITQFSNAQNGGRARDFMANNSMQIRLQNDFKKYYAGQYVLEIKRGERLPAGITITNEEAGLYLMAFDLKEPWATHRQYQVFGDKHTAIFGRPEVTSDRIVMCHAIMEAVIAATAGMKHKLCSKYVLTRYFMMYTIRLIIENDPIEKELLTGPKQFVREPAKRDKFRTCMRRIADDIVIDLNMELEPLGVDFDYRDKMRDEEWVKKLASQIVALRIKLVQRQNIKSMKASWEEQP